MAQSLRLLSAGPTFTFASEEMMETVMIRFRAMLL
jgi:hypothetical protein